MSSFRESLLEPVKVKTEELVWKGNKYILEGLPSADVVTGGIGPDSEKLAQMWAAKYKPVKFPVETVVHIQIVHSYLQPPLDKDGKAEAAWDITEIAGMYAHQGLLFNQLLNKASLILGSAGETAAKNS